MFSEDVLQTVHKMTKHSTEQASSNRNAKHQPIHTFDVYAHILTGHSC